MGGKWARDGWKVGEGWVESERGREGWRVSEEGVKRVSKGEVESGRGRGGKWARDGWKVSEGRRGGE